MAIFTTFISILLQSSFVLFLFAFGGQFLRRSWFNQGKINRARWCSRITFCASSLLAVVNIISMIVMPGGLNFFFAVFWCFIAWSDLQFLRQIGGAD